jgi:hypothetical protein
MENSILCSLNGPIKELILIESTEESNILLSIGGSYDELELQ